MSSISAGLPVKRFRRMAGMRVAFEGCCHGELDAIYATLRTLCERDGRDIDLLVCCGDFQAVRNPDDLECLACPPKYRAMHDFWRYYSGEKTAPIPTLFIGGNHEASNHSWELAYGGWAAPNIYYLGDAGVVNFGGIRFGGMSGIFNERHYPLGRFERPPYTPATMRSAYHVRALDVHRLRRLARAPDVMLSHDWPQYIARYGDTPALLRRKSFLRSEIDDGSLGSPAAAELLSVLRPAYWFSAHLHTKFAALVPHDGDTPPTRFLALDKCLPKRQFLQIVDFPTAQGPKQFHFDPDWAAVLRMTWSLNDWTRGRTTLPAGTPRPITEDQIVAAGDALRAAFADPESTDSLAIPATLFERTAATYDPGRGPPRGSMPRSSSRSPQTVRYLDALGLSMDDARPGAAIATGIPGICSTTNPEEIDLDEEDDPLDESVDVLEQLVNSLGSKQQTRSSATPQWMTRPGEAPPPTTSRVRNPEEIELDDC